MVPKFLYHYQPFNIDHIKQLLSDGEIKFSRPDKLNDPWDCRIHYSIPSNDGERRDAIKYFIDVDRSEFPDLSPAARAVKESGINAELTEHDENLNWVLNELTSGMQKEIDGTYRLYSMTDVPHHPLMWGHYAMSHTGICIEFDGRSAPFAVAKKVTYRNELPAQSLRRTDFDSLVTKSDDWKYENEYRIIAKDIEFSTAADTFHTKDDFLEIPREAIKSITLGCSSSDKDWKSLCGAVSVSGLNVLIRRARRSPTRYQLEFEPPFEDG